MRVAVTGTPGTGKTTATELVDTDLDVIHLNETIRERGLYDGIDERRDSVIADFEAIRDWLDDRDDVLIESHLAHHLPVDRVIVLRCHPEELERRLERRGACREKISENAESEALDLILSEAVANVGGDRVFEIDTTDRPREAVAADIETVLTGDREPRVGIVSFIDYL